MKYVQRIEVRLFESKAMGQYQIAPGAAIKTELLPGVPRIGDRVSYQYWELVVDRVEWNNRWVGVFLVTSGCRGFIFDEPEPTFPPNQSIKEGQLPPGRVHKGGQLPCGPGFLQTVRKFFR